jgi:hypothetical protein
MQKNKKRIVGEAEQPEIYCQNMDIDVDLENIAELHGLFVGH